MQEVCLAIGRRMAGRIRRGGKAEEQTKKNKEES